jgi:ribose transport system substrate-binding protein
MQGGFVLGWLELKMMEAGMRAFFRQIVVLAAMGLAGCTGSSTDSGDASSGSDRVTVGYVTTGIASFWLIAEKGALAGGKDFDAEVLVRMPPEGASDQKRMLEELLTMGVDGIAVSPIDPDNQQDIFDEVAKRTIFITQDSDAPNSQRRCYIGTDNYTAGRLCGELVKEALPDGGSVMIFIGRLGQLNSKQRRQGVIDELLDRSPDPNRYDEPGQELRGDKYTVIDTRTDQFDFAKAKALPEDAIARYPELGCMVGLFAYNPPHILEAVREAGKLGEIAIIGFDEAEETLQGIAEGEIYGTVVQDPYRYGYESVRVVAGLARGDETVLPEGGYMEIPTRKITRENIDEFWGELKRLTGDAESSDASAGNQDGQ